MLNSVSIVRGKHCLLSTWYQMDIPQRVPIFCIDSQL